MDEAKEDKEFINEVQPEVKNLSIDDMHDTPDLMEAVVTTTAPD